MVIKNITPNNYHCYKKGELLSNGVDGQLIEFGEKTTVLIGKNGSGKSSLLKALKVGLSVFFSNNYQWGKGSISDDVKELKPASLKSDEFWHDANGKPASFVEIKCEAEFCGEYLPKWTYYKEVKDGAKLQTKYFKDAFCKFMDLHNHNNVFPLMVYYSDRYPHIGSQLGSEINKMLSQKETIYSTWGYYHWDKENSFAEIWKRIFIDKQNELRDIDRTIENYIGGTENEFIKGQKIQRKELLRKLNFIKSHLIKFTTCNVEEYNDSEVDWQLAEIRTQGSGKYEDLLLISNNNISHLWKDLPAGYERLLTIVFDVACRSLVLNGPDKPVKGVVIIDEVDLHLHPTLQREVLQRLRLTFPEVQFIVSTHSPLVISHFPQEKGNKVIQFENVGDRYHHYDVQDWFGLSYEMILSMVMETEPDVRHLKDLCDTYVRYMRREKTEQAAEVKKKIEELAKGETLERILGEMEHRIKEG